MIRDMDQYTFPECRSKYSDIQNLQYIRVDSLVVCQCKIVGKNIRDSPQHCGIGNMDHTVMAHKDLGWVLHKLKRMRW